MKIAVFRPYRTAIFLPAPPEAGETIFLNHLQD